MHIDGEFAEININDILPNRFQPRIHFDEKRLNQLASSIYEYGVIQPIIVRKVNDKYEIISGERRFKASKLANKATIPAIITNLTDRASEEIALLENIQRQDLTAIEEAVSYKRILDSGYMTQEELAKKLGKSQPTIANKVRLLNLDDEVQEALLHGKISERHARSLLKLTNREIQKKMLHRIIEERLTVRKTDEEIAKELQNMKIEQPKEVMVAQEEKPIFLQTSNNTENLFNELETLKNDERKDGFMDIDKIMREAKDINTENKTNDMNKLMQQDAQTNINNQNTQTINPVSSIPSAPSANMEPAPQNSQPIENDDNKFVHYIPKEEPKVPQNEPVHPNGVSFDSIFNATPETIQSQKPQETVVNSSVPENNIASAVSAAFDEVNNKAVETKSESNLNNIPNTLESQNIPITPNVDSPQNINSFENQNLQTPSIPEINSPSANTLENTNPSTIQNQGISASSLENFANAPENNLNNQSIPQNNDNHILENIPKEDIYEDNDSLAPDNLPSMIETPTKTVNANFSSVIHLIRECTDKIEAMGYNINVDEADLNDKYQVTIIIDK